MRQGGKGGSRERETARKRKGERERKDSMECAKKKNLEDGADARQDHLSVQPAAELFRVHHHDVHDHRRKFWKDLVPHGVPCTACT